MSEIVIDIMIPILVVSLIIFLLVYNTKNSNNDKEPKSNNNNEEEAKTNNDNKENKNEIVFSSKNFFEIGFAFGLGAIIAEIVFLIIAFLICVPIYLLFK